MHTSLRLVLIIMMVFAEPLCADSWQFDKEIKSDTFTFGEIEVTRIIDTRENQGYPEFTVKVARDGKEIALLKNLTFDSITSFDKGNYLLGVSNSGLSTFAYFILDSTGNLIRAENHSNKLNYCNQSVTLVRDWVNDQDIDVREKYRTHKNELDPDNPYVTLESVTINGCSGERVEVWAQ
ncbi:MAG: hypothetical protein OER96_01660 [Gammaproteobacteria bacterium]|nr:hypothetical protein [Gammaproteobacteria bacterium]